MARTFLRQVTQIRNSDSYDDTQAAGSTLETGQTNIEGDLNAVRSQLKRAVFADSAGDWFADIPTVNSKKRAISALNSDLDDLEEKRILFRTQVLTDVSVTASQNWEILSVAGLETPTVVRASGATTLGAVVSTSAFSGAGFNVHELVEVAGANATAPKNLVEVRDSTTGQVVQSSGRDVFGLLQAESTGTDGTAFDDTSAGNRAKISFVRLTAGLDDLEACPVADIAGKTVNYSYARRVRLDDIPEQAFIVGSSFVDQSASTDVTLDRAIDNQSGAATQDQDIDWKIADTKTLDFQDPAGGVNLMRIAPNAAGDEIEFNVDDLDVNNVNRADFLNGVRFDSGGTAIDVGDVAGEVLSAGILRLKSAATFDLTLDAGGEISLIDTNKAGSTFSGLLKLSDTSAEWSAYETAYGGEVSLLYAVGQARRRTKTYANVTANTSADTDVGGVSGGTNLDAQLPDMSLGSFVSDYDVFLNGELLRPGADATANNDYYPGTSTANGQLRFEFQVKSGDVVCVIPYVR